MKKYILIVILLCIPISVGAWGLLNQMGGVPVESGGSCDTSVDVEDGTPTGDNTCFNGSTAIGIGNQFLTTEAYDLCKVTIALKRNNDVAQAMTIHAEIWSDDASNLPNAQVGADSENTITRTSDLTTSYQDITFTWASAISLSNATYYFIVIVSDASSSANYVQWEKIGTATGVGANEEIGKSDAAMSWANLTSYNSATMETFK